MLINILIVCLNFNYCLVGNSNEAHLSTSKVFRSDCSFVNLKRQTNTADKGVVLFLTKDKTHSFFNDNRQRIVGTFIRFFGENFVVFCSELKENGR